MTKKEYMLSGDLGNWRVFADIWLSMPENEATAMWNNYHNIGKYLICESRENNSTRLFIRNVTNTITDAFQKKGWWNTFTVTKTGTPKGMWLCKVIEYRLDRNGFLNLEVETILPVDDIKIHILFEPEDGTWNSIGWRLMMVCSNAFLREYNFPECSYFHKPNYTALREKYPELSGMKLEDMGKTMLLKYLRNEVTLEEIEECLNKPSEWADLVTSIQKSVANHTIDRFYGEEYPLFTAKISNNVIKNEMVNVLDVENYLKRQIEYYEKLVNDQKIKAVDGGWLSMIESALRYRKALKDAEKAAKKEKRKERKK